MIDVTPTQIMGLWEQLFHCLYDNNSYGGTVAEIYLYTVMQRDPFVEMTRGSNPDHEHVVTAFAEANRNLHGLCRLFEQRNDVTLYLFDGPSDDGWHSAPLPLDDLIADPSNPWQHRVHIGIKEEDQR